MPGNDNVIAARGPRTTPLAPPTTTSARPQPAPPSTAQVREGAIADVSALRQRRAPAALSPQRAMTRIAAVFEQGQREGRSLQAVRDALADDPRLLRTLAAIPEDTLRSTLRPKVGVLDCLTLTHEIKDVVRSRLVDGVRNEALARVGRQIRTLEQARDSLTARMPEMDAAERAEAQAAIAVLDRGIEGYRGLKARLYGTRWSLGDFQRAGERALLANGFTTRGVAWELLSETDRSSDRMHAAEMALHVAVDSIEFGHVAHAFGAASAGAIVGVAALGIAAGMYIHHAAAEVHAHDVALGRRLGL